MPKHFADKPHNWDEILIDYDGRRITRGQIKNYYEKNIHKIFPYLKNRNVIVILGVGKNKFVLKRLLTPTGPNIHITKERGIEDPNSLEYWINRRAIEFHPTIGTRTDHIWVDIDVHNGNHLSKYAKTVAKDIAKILKRNFGGRITVWDSGKRGIHVENLLKEKVNTDAARRKLLVLLGEYTKKDPERLTTKIARKNMLRLDVTTLKKTGSIRAPYSFSVIGKAKIPLR